MDQFLRDKNKDTILFVNSIAGSKMDDVMEGLSGLKDILKRKLKVVVIIDRRDKKAILNRSVYPKSWRTIVVNTKSVIQVEKAILPFADRLIAVNCTSEKSIPFLRNIIPHVPYVETPTAESLVWSEDKLYMRRRLRSYKKKLSPAYTVIQDTSKESFEKIRKQVGYPAIVKPTGLAASALVGVVYDEEEAIKIIKKTLRKMRSVYKEKGYLKTPKLLIEQFMEGEMYSTDVYVNSRGTMYTTPLVHIMTGFKAGKGDFFGYRQMTPVLMKPYKHQAAFDAAKESVIAMGLRSITAHIELMKTVDGWKIIEVNPRVGGFRAFMYSKSYGINHYLNDLLIRLPMRPIISRKAKGYSVVMKFFPEKEGVLKRIVGKQKITKLNSYCKHEQNKKNGEKLLFAHNGGGSVLAVYMFNEKRSGLLADIHRLEQILRIEVDTSRKPPAASLLAELANPMAEGLGAIPQG